MFTRYFTNMYLFSYSVSRCHLSRGFLWIFCGPNKRTDILQTTFFNFLLMILESSAAITRYCILYPNDWSRVFEVSFLIHKWHPICRPNGRDVGCLYIWGFFGTTLYIPEGLIYNTSVLVHVLNWYRTGDKPLPGLFPWCHLDLVKLSVHNNFSTRIEIQHLKMHLYICMRLE